MVCGEMKKISRVLLSLSLLANFPAEAGKSSFVVVSRWEAAKGAMTALRLECSEGASRCKVSRLEGRKVSASKALEAAEAQKIFLNFEHDVKGLPPANSPKAQASLFIELSHGALTRKDVLAPGSKSPSKLILAAIALEGELAAFFEAR